MANISDILNRPAEDVKPPPLYPAGLFRTIIKGLPEQGESSLKKTPYLRFTYQVTAAGPDVEEEDIATFESDGESKIVGHTFTNDYYTTEKALFMLTEFLQQLGIDFSGGKSISAAIDETPNLECMITVKHVPSSDGKRFFARIGSTAAIPEDEAEAA